MNERTPKNPTLPRCASNWCGNKARYEAEAWLVGPGFRGGGVPDDQPTETLHVCGTHRNVLQDGGTIHTDNHRRYKGKLGEIQQAEADMREAAKTTRTKREWLHDSHRAIGRALVEGNASQDAVEEMIRGGRTLMEDVIEAEATQRECEAILKAKRQAAENRS